MTFTAGVIPSFFIYSCCENVVLKVINMIQSMSREQGGFTPDVMHVPLLSMVKQEAHYS